MKKLLTGILLCLSLTSFGQVAENQDVPVDGTYQMIVKNNGKKEMVFTTNFIQGLSIESYRQEKSDTTIVVNKWVSVFIPSKEKIKSEEFKALELTRYE